MDEETKEHVESFRENTEVRLEQLEKAVKELSQQIPPSTGGGT